MEISWTTAAPLIINLGALATVWWQLDAKMEKKIEAIDRKFDTMNTTLLTLTHDVGELKRAGEHLDPQRRPLGMEAAIYRREKDDCQ